MTCYKCGGPTSPGATTSTMERGPTLLVVRHVPAEVCQQCGEDLVAPQTAERLRALLDAAVSAKVVTSVQEFSEDPYATVAKEPGSCRARA